MKKRIFGIPLMYILLAGAAFIFRGQLSGIIGKVKDMVTKKAV